MSIIDKMRRVHGELHERKKRKKDTKIILSEIEKSSIQIMTIDETLDCLERGLSIARFGDGEFNIIAGGGIAYQTVDVQLANRLREILVSKPTNCLIGVPDAISTLDNLTAESLEFWTQNMIYCRKKWVELLTEKPDPIYRYGNTNVSRCYIRYQNKQFAGVWFERLMGVWQDKNVVVIEGEKTRLGCKNDFLKNAKSVKRIIGPAENAFAKIHEILKYVSENVDRSSVILLALGPTATVMAYELAQMGYQALDLGHCDIEYEWYCMGAVKKVAIQGKYTNEAKNGRIVDNSTVDDDYLSQIIKRIT